MQARPNVVQAEFFLPVGSLTLKRTVRFFDQQNNLTLLALKIELLESKKLYYLHRFGYANGWLQKRFFRFMCARTDRQLIRLAEIKIELAHQRLLEVGEDNSFAVKQGDRHFRPAQPNDFPGILKTVENVRGVCLFVFAHNDLCADKNVSIASAM